MSTEVSKPIQETGIKSMIQSPQVMKRLEEILGKRASTFATSVVQICNQNTMLRNAEPTSVLNAAMVSATLDLPLNNQLGFSWIVPYGKDAQFQIGWKGLVQLAQRTGQYLRINVVPVYENQFKSWNSLTEDLEADFLADGAGRVVGYCAYFKMLNGFEKTVYWSIEKVTTHGKKYSKSFSSGPWKTEFDKMAMKTVLKHTLSNWGFLSIEMQQAIRVDQAVIKDENAEDISYVDNEPEEINKEAERATLVLRNCKTIKDVVDRFNECTPDIQVIVEDVRVEMMNKLGAEEK